MNRLLVLACAGAVGRRSLLLGAGGGALGVAGLALAKPGIDGPTLPALPPGVLAGRTALVTGATGNGLGKETALRLASAGCRVFIGARSQARGEAALTELRSALAAAPAGAGTVELLVFDLASLESVRGAAAALATRSGGRLDVLVNNAGVMAIPQREATADGFERQVGVNHLGHYALTAALLPLLKAAPSGRVVNVASAAHLFAPAGSPLVEGSPYAPWGAYGASKLANILFTNELDARFKAAGLPLTAVSCHPGVVRTDLGRYLIGSGAEGVGAPAVASGLAGVVQAAGLQAVAFFTRDVAHGAATQLWLASGADGGAPGTYGAYAANGGGYFADLRPGQRSAASMDPALGAALWAESAALTGARWDI
jgi:NAD(P)-dependent dehydrogenase (short-subunit alcohol dehydrogenase family)